MPNWNKVVVSGSRAHLIAVTASSQIAINPVAASTEVGLIVGPGPAGGAGEGGQIALQPASGFTSGSFIDQYQTGTTPYIRILRGTAANSDALVTQWNVHTKQMHLPAYNSVASFSGTAVAALAVNSSGDVITIATSSGGGGGGSGTVNGGTSGFLAYYPSTGTTVDDVSGVSWDSTNNRLAVTGSVIATANGAMYFRGGDDAEFWDINVANTVGIYGQQNADRAGLKLGSSGPTLFGSASRFGIGTTTPTLGILEVNGNVYATSFTGSLQGTSSWASNVVGGIGVTSVGTAGTVSGITLTGGTITSTGTITLGGSISGLTNSNLSGTAGITNANLANSSVTVGSTSISLGSSATTIAGLSSVTSTTFVGALTGNASTATTAATASKITSQGSVSGGTHYFLISSDNISSGPVTTTVRSSNLTYNSTANTLATTASWASNATTASYATIASQLTPGGTTGYVPIWSSNTQLNNSVIYEKLGSIGINTGVVSAHPGILTINGSGTTALVVTGSTILTGSVHQVYGNFIVTDATGVPSADLGAARLLRDATGALSIDYSNRIHYDASGTKSAINNRFRYLIASNGTTTVNWDDNASGLRLFDKYTTSSVDWGNRILYDDGILFSGVPKDSINWNTRECLDVSTSQSISWGARRLTDATGNATVNWGAYVLADNVGNQALSWDAASSNNRQSLHAPVFMRTEIELASGTIEQFSDMNSYSFYPEGRVIRNATIDGGVVDYNFVFLDTDGTWKAVDNASTRATKMLGVAFSVGGDNKILLDGHLPINSANISNSPYVVGVDHGLPIYLSASFAATTTVPTVTGEYVRILGHAYYQNSSPDYWVMNFSPDHTWVQL